MVDFIDEVRGRELCELIFDGFFSVLCESAKSLLDWFSSFFYVKGVLDHLPGDTRHVGGFPRKDILVCPKEGDERAFLFWVKLVPIRAVLAGSNESSSIFLNSWLELILDLASFLARISPSS